MAVITTIGLGGKPHIVVVTDDRYTLRRMQYLVSTQSVLLHACRLGRELLNEVDTRHCDCLVLESRLEDMDGLALYGTLARKGAIAPTIFLADVSEPSSRAVDAMKAGAFDYIEKPFSSQRLISALHAALSRESVSQRPHYRAY